MIFPCSNIHLSSSRERAYNLGKNLRQIGWRVTIVPFQLELEQRRRILRLENPHILYIQKGRHPLNFTHLYNAAHIVFDIDDADFLDPKQTDQVIQCCRESELVICGSKFVANFCRQYNTNIHIVWSGMEFQARNYLPSSQRRRIVAWGTSDSIGYIKEREFLIEAIVKLRKKIDFEFWVYGVRDIQALQHCVNQLAQHKVETKLIPPLSFDRYHTSLEQVAVGVHPVSEFNPYSWGKSFGKLNSYIQCGVPIVVQNLLDYPAFFRDGENGMLANELDEWIEKLYQLLAEPELRDNIAVQATLDFQQELSSQAVARKVNFILESLLK